MLETSTAPTGLFVTAGNTGLELANKLLARGVKLVHISTSQERRIVHRSSDFQDIFVSDELAPECDLKKFSEYLRDKYKPNFVLAGSEFGVRLADKLAQLLSMPYNGDSTIAVFRDKHLMIERAKESGFHVPLTHHITSMADVARIQSEFLTMPLVVKPAQSTGGYQVSFCHNLQEIHASADEILSTDAMDENIPQSVLLQEYLEGHQCFVNAITSNGEHHITDIWMRDRVTLPDCRFWRVALLEHNDPVAGQLQSFTSSLLSSYGLRHGASHTEIMMTKKGPYLIETAARHAGTTLPACAFDDVLENSQLDLIVDQCFNRRTINEKAEGGYSIRKNAYIIPIIALQSGVLESYQYLDEIERLDSMVAIRLRKNPGAHVMPYTTLAHVLGYIMLANNSMPQLQRDYRTLRTYTKSGLARVRVEES